MTVEHGFQHTDTDELSNAPARIDVRRKISTQWNRADLSSVGDCERLKDTPRDPTQDLSGEQSVHTLRSEENGCEAGDENKAGHDGL